MEKKLILDKEILPACLHYERLPMHTAEKAVQPSHIDRYRAWHDLIIQSNLRRAQYNYYELLMISEVGGVDSCSQPKYSVKLNQHE